MAENTEDRNHRYGSVDYKIINKTIRTVLDRRSRLDNTVQVAMPFVKATTTLDHEFLGSPEENNIGFTLGLHGINNDVAYEEMYSPVDVSSPLIGYTYGPNGAPNLVYAVNPEFTRISTRVEQLFDRQSSIVTYPNDYNITGIPNYTRVPPPGITNMTVGRNKNGLLAVAQLDITIPSLIQLESLHRTFLVPGLGMVVEWGQQFALDSVPTNSGVFGELPDIGYNQLTFPWTDRAKLRRMLHKLARREVGLQDIMDKYVYPTTGQYMWMFGRVANFSIQSNSDGSFNANVKIVGPSEDAWAYSTTTTVVPKKDPSADLCASNANSVQSYFMKTVLGGFNLKTLLDNVVNGSILPDWKQHVQHIKQGNQSEGEPKKDTSTGTVDEATFQDSPHAYFMTWRFFVNVVINDDVHGIKAILRRGGISPEKLATIGLLLPYAHGPSRENSNVAKIKYIDDPKESFVGANVYLRSIDPSTLLIINAQAIRRAEQNTQYNIPTLDKPLIDPYYQGVSNAKPFIDVGWFGFGATARTGTESYLPSNEFDRGFLSSGVWLNHKAVVEAMLGADTIMRGISNLLERMNSATRGYWQLTLDQIEGDEQLPNPHSYIVVDANWRDSSENAVANFIENVHVFNKYVRKSLIEIPSNILASDGELVGSDLIECSVDLSLPRRVFSQIATLGLLSKTEVDAAVAGANPEEAGSIKVSDPNDTLAKMFGITSLSIKNGKGQSPDLTVLLNDDSQTANICGEVNAQTPANTAGFGQQVGGIDLSTAPRSKSELESAYKKASDKLKTEICVQCEQCKSTSTSETTVATAVSTTNRENITGNTVSYTAKNGQTIVVPIVHDDRGSNAISTALYDAGYRNGKIPNEYLKVVNGNHRLYPDAADAFIEMQAKYKADTGKTFSIREAYRSFQTQVDYIPRLGWYGRSSGQRASAPIGSPEALGTAAIPGTSNHGFGLAVDISTGGKKEKSDEYIWLSRNARTFGFTTVPGEPHHWEYTTGQLKSTPRPINTPSTQPPSSPTTGNSQAIRGGEHGENDSRVWRTAFGNEGVGRIATIVEQKTGLVVQLESGQVVRRGGSRSWRNNNPGNIKFTEGGIAQRLGAIGTDGEFAVFPDYDTGRKAKEELLFNSARYRNLTVREAILRWEYGDDISNANPRYQEVVLAAVGENFVLATMNSENRIKMLDAMERHEGYRSGIIEILDDSTATIPQSPQPGTAPPTQSLPREIETVASEFCIENQEECDKCERAKSSIRELDEITALTGQAEEALRKYYGLRNHFWFIEPYHDLMVALITSTANGNVPNAFGAAPGSLAITADLVMPGINGIRVGELFWIDRIPAFYKVFGAFQVMSVEDTIGLDGWKTKIHSRFNYLGTKWKAAVYEKLKSTV
jgi:hypothetical protein